MTWSECLVGWWWVMGMSCMNKLNSVGERAEPELRL